MDKRAAEQYLRQIYGTQQGYVAVGYKDRDNTWHEDQFAWPSEKAKLLTWAERDSNIFICPALRRNAHTRKKGDMLPTRWLWADVDWQTVPADKLEEVNRRIAELGGVTVLSGSGDNVHVYVELSRQVDASEHAKLNTGLRDYLYADNKQADNSLLRLPGTTNWKTDQGSPVQWQKKTSRAMSPDALLKRRVFRDAKVPPEVEAAEWDFVPMDGVSKRVMRLVQMPVDESLGRYGKRHKAVWAVTKQLTRWGYGPDEVHSLMHTFPPALDKMAEENGYDPHLDIDRCLAAVRATEKLTEAQQSDIEEDVFELADEADDLAEFEERVRRLAQAELERSEARRRARALEAERTWVSPPDDVSWVLTDVLSDPPEPAQYLIGIPPDGKKGLCGIKHNVVVTAQYKTGKTKFIISTIAKALADGTDFMGDVPVHTPPGGVVVGHWNCEMDPAEIAADYVIPAGIQNTHNLVGANLRGHRVNLLSDQGKAWAVQWLRDRKVKVWTIDSLARIARMAGVSENENEGVTDLCMAIDEVKVEAEVDAIFLITHTGRAQQEEGKERSRGATFIDDWPDARWIMTNEGGVRFLTVDGRGVGMAATPLIYNEETGHSDRGYGGREEVKQDGGVQTVVRIVSDTPGITQSALFEVMKKKRISQRVAAHYIEEAIEGNFIEVKPDPSGRGRAAKRHYLTGGDPVEGDRTRQATSGVVDFRTVRRGRRGLKSST